VLACVVAIAALGLLLAQRQASLAISPSTDGLRRRLLVAHLVRPAGSLRHRTGASAIAALLNAHRPGDPLPLDVLPGPTTTLPVAQLLWL